MKVRVYLVPLVTAALCLLLAGCIIAPIPSPTRRVGPTGKLGRLNLESFTPGKTTRDEVTRQLSAVDTGIKLPNAFWARWEKSKWTWFMAAGAGTYGTADAKRSWSAENFVAEFDDAGTLKNWRIVRDGDLAAELARFVAGEKRWESDVPVEWDVLHLHGFTDAGATLLLHRDYIQLVEPNNKAKHTFKGAPSELAEVECGNIEHETKTVNIGVIRVGLRFRTSPGDLHKMNIAVSPEHLVDLLAYVRERAPQALIK